MCKALTWAHPCIMLRSAAILMVNVSFVLEKSKHSRSSWKSCKNRAQRKLKTLTVLVDSQIDLLAECTKESRMSYSA